MKTSDAKFANRHVWLHERLAILEAAKTDLIHSIGKCPQGIKDEIHSIRKLLNLKLQDWPGGSGCNGNSVSDVHKITSTVLYIDGIRYVRVSNDTWLEWPPSNEEMSPVEDCTVLEMTYQMWLKEHK